MKSQKQLEIKKTKLQNAGKSSPALPAKATEALKMVESDPPSLGKDSASSAPLKSKSKNLSIPYDK
jgi:hypothetical protein